MYLALFDGDGIQVSQAQIADALWNSSSTQITSFAQQYSLTTQVLSDAPSQLDGNFTDYGSVQAWIQRSGATEMATAPTTTTAAATSTSASSLVLPIVIGVVGGTFIGAGMSALLPKGLQWVGGLGGSILGGVLGYYVGK